MLHKLGFPVCLFVIWRLFYWRRLVNTHTQGSQSEVGYHNRPSGVMESASDFESEGCGFKSHLGRSFCNQKNLQCFYTETLNHGKITILDGHEGFWFHLILSMSCTDCQLEPKSRKDSHPLSNLSRPVRRLECWPGGWGRSRLRDVWVNFHCMGQLRRSLGVSTLVRFMIINVTNVTGCLTIG